MRDDVIFYAHINPSTREVFYVGIGNKQRPYSKYRSELWKRHVSKYGYEVVILARGLRWDVACMLEKDFIRTLGKRCDKTGILVNMTDGGEGTRGLKQSEARKEYMRNLFKGKPCSEEQKRQISKTLKGRKLTEEHKINIGLGGKGRVFSEKHLHNLHVKCAKHKTLLCKLYKVKKDIVEGLLTKNEIQTKHNLSDTIYYKVLKVFNIPKAIKIPKSHPRKEEAVILLKRGVKNIDIIRQLDMSESTVIKIKRQLKLQQL